MSSDLAIEVEGLSKCYEIFAHPRDRIVQLLCGKRVKRYREKWALKDVAFSVRRGQTVGVIGLNGSGKSTLLQILSGTLEPTAGRVKTHGRIAALLELGAGFNPEFTGLENVRLSAALYGLSKQQIEARLDKITAFSGIGDYVHQPVKYYSSGMLVRLAFSVIAHVDADILIIDEALSVGDAFFNQKCMRFLHDFMKTGTVFFVSHDTGAVTSLCERVIWLSHGQVRMDTATKSVMEQYLAALHAEEDRVPDSTTSLELPSDFGQRGAVISSAELLSESGQPMVAIEGGEKASVVIRCSFVEPLLQPIVGFVVKNRYGQSVFGENSSQAYPKFQVEAGRMLETRFDFTMPILPAGEYILAAAVASGTQMSHVQHHWIHDSLRFTARPRTPCHGLVGVLLLNAQMELVENNGSGGT
jgi:lipopolysaccharide transport system ATP-binding protein